MTKNVFKYGILLLMVLISVALVASPAAADPVMTRTLSETTVAPGDTVHVTLDLTNYVDEQSLNSMQEDYSAAEMDGWTVSNVLLPPGWEHVPGSVHNFWYPSITINLPAGDYTVKYALTVDADTAVGVYDLTGKYLDSGNSAGYPAVGDTQLTVVDPSSSSTGNTDVTDNTSSASSSSTKPSVSAVEQEPGVIVEGSETEIVVEEVIAEDNSEEQLVDDTEPQVDTEYQDVENQESDPKSPGFEMMVAVSGLLMSVYMAKRD